MSPIGGVGINLAVQDAVAAATLLAAPLLRGAATPRELARVRTRRLLPTIAVQTLQRIMHRGIAMPILDGRRMGPPKPLVMLMRQRAEGVVRAGLSGRRRVAAGACAGVRAPPGRQGVGC